MLARGDLVPHFVVTTVDNQRISYGTIWQKKNLVLVTLPASEAEDSGGSLVDQLVECARQSDPGDTTWVITRDQVPGIPRPAVVIADRWGEIVELTQASDVGGLLHPSAILEWVEYVRHQCPECQGEAK